MFEKEFYLEQCNYINVFSEKHVDSSTCCRKVAACLYISFKS